MQIDPSAGGDVELPGLTQSTGSVELSSSSGTLSAPELSAFTQGTVVDSGGTFTLPALTDADNSTFQVSGGVTLTLPRVTQADASNLEVSGSERRAANSDELHERLRVWDDPECNR